MLFGIVNVPKLELWSVRAQFENRTVFKNLFLDSSTVEVGSVGAVQISKAVGIARLTNFEMLLGDGRKIRVFRDQVALLPAADSNDGAENGVALLATDASELN